MEEFDMSREEAVKEARDQFAQQGVNLRQPNSRTSWWLFLFYGFQELSQREFTTRSVWGGGIEAYSNSHILVVEPITASMV